MTVVRPLAGKACNNGCSLHKGFAANEVRVALRVHPRPQRKFPRVQAMAESSASQDLQDRKNTLEKMYVDSKKSFPNVS